jgi:putative spermidine/putrescine transport system substrate-binding protein
MKHKSNKSKQTFVFCPSRRKMVSNIAVLGMGAVLTSKSPYVFARQKTKLRVLGTGVTLQEPLRAQAMDDLGIELIFELRDGDGVLQKAIAAPSSFDVYEQWSNSVNVLWRSGSIQPIEKKRIIYWDEINSLTKTGQLTEYATIGAGDAPYKLLHVQGDNSLGSNHTPLVSFLPYVHNVDSFGYNNSIIPKGRPYETESWGWLLEDRFAGKVAVINSPSIGLFDLAMAAQAKGLVRFANIGAMTKPELDALFEVLAHFKRQNHFSGFWSTVPQSVEYMTSNRVVLESLFSPALAALNRQGVPVTYAAPKEGYRGWHGVMCLSSATKGREKDVAYEYLNWWLSGWAGAQVARQGYYICNPQRSAKYLSSAELDYWYQGKPATQALNGTDGKISVNKGSIRNGGDYLTRMSHIAVWNTVMPNHDYSLQKWYQFIGS